jgi:hypothetical protein
VQNDKGCWEPQSGQLYVFGEIVNSTSQAHDLDDMQVEVRGPAGDIPATSVIFDVPVYFVAPNGRLPFVLNARLAEPAYTSYSVTVSSEPGVHAPRDDLRIDEFNPTSDEEVTEISGKWTNSATPPPSRFVAIIAVLYDPDGRVNNMGYLYITNTSVVPPGLPPGQHLFEGLYLDPSPCGPGTLVMSIIGE